MSIKLTIHSLDVESKVAVITLTDSGHMIINKKSLSNIELDETGNSANTIWLQEKIKEYVFPARVMRLERKEKDIV
jgi:hypothetical protein